MIEDKTHTSQTIQVPLDLGGYRLDQALSALFPEFSRSRHQDWIRRGLVLVDGHALSGKQRLIGGEMIVFSPEPDPTPSPVTPQKIPLEIIFEDRDILVVNKPAGLVVHPAAGHADGTLQNALLNYLPSLAQIPRCGIVHRIDKDTSGLLMVAKTLQSHHSLVDQLQSRTIDREYIALVQGTIVAGGTIDQPIGRHPTDRKKFSVNRGGKLAITHYRVIEKFTAHTLVRVKLETGRTHQIRVHMAHINHPLVGDPVYGGRARLPAGAEASLISTLRSFRRQALHAHTLGLSHPETEDHMEWSVELPQDFKQLLDALRGLV